MSLFDFNAMLTIHTSGSSMVSARSVHSAYQATRERRRGTRAVSGVRRPRATTALMPGLRPSSGPW
jgi:hypothetical protein